ncbi:MAG: tyrosine-type recombinase/integrase [Candidatus Bathyarchaeota archaeon]
MAYLNRKQLAPFTKLNYLICVRKYLRWEVQNGIINEDLLVVLDNAHLPKIPQYLPKPLFRETDSLLQNKLRQSSSPYAPLFLLLRLTGLRISELINLPWDCLFTNFKNEHFLKVPIGKLDNERLVPLNHETIQLIQKIKDCYPIKKGKCDKTRLIGFKGDVSTYVYPLLRHQFKKMLGHLTTDQGKPITFHRLRHTYATSLLTGGVSIVSIMKLLGHKRIEMSLRYAKVTPSHLRNEYLAAMDVLEKKWTTERNLLPKENRQSIDPAYILSQLRAFAAKSANLDDHQKKILLRRLSRLHHYLASITFSQKFKLHS